MSAFCSQGSAAISIGSPTTQWKAIVYANPSSTDPINDHQTGISEGDIVGNASHAAYYTIFDDGGTIGNLTDGEIGFRVRVAADSNPPGLNVVVWVGLDVNVDGKIDLFAGAFEGATIGFYPAGNGANISPSTTSIVSSSPYSEVTVTALNFDYSPVTLTNDPAATNTNLDGGSGGGTNHTDHFASMKFDFATLVSAVNSLTLPGVGSFNQNSPLQYVVATSNQKNALNQDISGINGGTSSSVTFASLGAFAPVSSASGAPMAVPEPSYLILCHGMIFALAFRRRRGIPLQG